MEFLGYKYPLSLSLKIVGCILASGLTRLKLAEFFSRAIVLTLVIDNRV